MQTLEVFAIQMIQRGGLMSFMNIDSIFGFAQVMQIFICIVIGIPAPWKTRGGQAPGRPKGTGLDAVGSLGIDH